VKCPIADGRRDRQRGGGRARRRGKEREEYTGVESHVEYNGKIQCAREREREREREGPEEARQAARRGDSGGSGRGI